MVLYPACIMCQHLHMENSTTCDAFPDGIPVMEVDKHDRDFRPCPGENGVDFLIKENIDGLT